MVEKLIEQMTHRMVGKIEQVEKVVLTLLAGGHLLIEDVPGVGKTTLAKALAESVEGTFQRVQFTADLMPSDISGINVFMQNSDTFVLRKGPIFSNILLADEINRSNPKTQSALLEAMAERQVTIDGVCYPLDDPFMVIATQNPLGYQGTFPLLESQLDRFMLKITIGYPDAHYEEQILELDEGSSLAPIMTINELRRNKEVVQSIYVEASLKTYLVQLVGALREDERVRLAPSPRASKDLFRAMKARAYLKNRSYVLPEDLQKLAVDVLAHRLLLHEEVRYRGVTHEQVVRDHLRKISVPRVKRP